MWILSALSVRQLFWHYWFYLSKKSINIYYWQNWFFSCSIEIVWNTVFHIANRGHSFMTFAKSRKVWDSLLSPYSTTIRFWPEIPYPVVQWALTIRLVYLCNVFFNKRVIRTYFHEWLSNLLCLDFKITC